MDPVRIGVRTYFSISGNGFLGAIDMLIQTPLWLI